MYIIRKKKFKYEELEDKGREEKPNLFFFLNLKLLNYYCDFTIPFLFNTSIKYIYILVISNIFKTIYN